MTVMKRIKKKTGKLVSPNWFIEFTHKGVTRRATSGIPCDKVGGKAEAKAMEARWRADIDEDVKSGRTKATLDMVMTRYFNAVIKPKLPEELLKDPAKLSQLDFKKKAKRILAHFHDDKVLDQITDTAIAEWAESMQVGGLLEHKGNGVWVANEGKGLKPRSINAHLACLRAVLKKAVKWKYLAVVPDVDLVGGKEKKMRFLYPDEADALVKGALPDKSANTDSRHLQQLVRFLLGTGARKSEALGLIWRHVDLANNGMAWVRFEDTKTDVPRTVPIGDTLRDMLIDMKAEQQRLGYTGNKVFVYFNGREWIEIKSVGSSFLTARRKAGLGKDVTLHTLRHTYASWMLQDNQPLKKVSQLLGHASVAITADLYGHVESKHLESSVSVLEKRMTQLAA